jgi:energy-coupling factor transporter ATP-binding protein EcfA2
VYHSAVIKRLYIHNFRCLENFELPVSGLPSALLIGGNGSGKTTVSFALEILQKIARGTNRVGELVKPKDLLGRKGVPMRLEIEVDLHGRTHAYSVAFEFPEGFRELRIFDEKLSVDGNPIFTRELAQVNFVRSGHDKEARFSIDWHLAALPIIQQQSVKDPLFVLKQWLARMLILRPIPPLILGKSEHDTLEPHPHVTDLGAWFSGLLAFKPAAYTRIAEYLKQVMPDLEDIRNPLAGGDTRMLEVQFTSDPGPGTVCFPFEDLSDGEKCFMICALVLAANEAYGPLLCFWDEPDNFLAPSEVQHFVMALRKAFQAGGQFIATSHNPEAIRSFSDENTLLLSRKSHLEPTIVRPVGELKVSGDLVDALTRGDVQP